MSNEMQWSVEELVKILKNVQEIDKDSLNAIDGGTGVGKSTLGIKLCKRGCPWFDMEKDILYSQKEIIEWVTTAKPGSWGLADEIVNALFKRDFAAKGQKFLLKILDMCRNRNLTLFMCIPNFWALDKHILDGRIRLRIHVSRTGFAFMWKPSTNPFAPDRWYRKYNEKVCYNWDNYPNARKTKGFVGYLKFGDLGVREREQYEEIKERKKAQIKKEQEEEEAQEVIQKKRSVDLGKTMILSFLQTHGLLKTGAYSRLAEIEGVTTAAIGKRVRDYNEKYDPQLEVELLNPRNKNKQYNNNLIK